MFSIPRHAAKTPFLDWDILLYVLPFVSYTNNIWALMQTCQLLYSKGMPHLIREIELRDFEDIMKFCSFMMPDPLVIDSHPSRFRAFHVLCIEADFWRVAGTEPSSRTTNLGGEGDDGSEESSAQTDENKGAIAHQATSLFIELLSRARFLKDLIIFGDVEGFLTLIEPLYDAVVSLPALERLSLPGGVGDNSMRILRDLKSSLSELMISLANTSSSEDDRLDIFDFLEPLRHSLTILDFEYAWLRIDAVPRVQFLEMRELNLQTWTIPWTASIMSAFPNLCHFHFVELSDSETNTEAIPAHVLEIIRTNNLNRIRQLSEPWTELEHLTMSFDFVWASGLTCTVDDLHLCDAMDATVVPRLWTMLGDLKPSSLMITLEDISPTNPSLTQYPLPPQTHLTDLVIKARPDFGALHNDLLLPDFPNFLRNTTLEILQITYVHGDFESCNCHHESDLDGSDDAKLDEESGEPGAVTIEMYLRRLDPKEFVMRIAEAVPSLRSVTLDLHIPSVVSCWRVAQDPEDGGRISVEIDRETAEARARHIEEWSL